MNMSLENRLLRAALCALCVLALCASMLTGIVPAGKAYADNENEEAELPPYTPPEELAEGRARNADVIALLNIPSTGTCYPILQHPTVKDYYLNITIDGDEGYPGSIYTNPIEGRKFDTFNTVIYGHNMRDGSYFGNLKSFRDPDYLAGHRQIEIYTDTQKHVYDIFAVVIYSDRNVADDFRDEDTDDRAAFLESLKHGGEGSILLDDVDVSADSRLVTLSTCISDMHDNRLLIVAAERDAEAPNDPPVLTKPAPEPVEADPYLA